MNFKERIITALPAHAACFTNNNGAVIYVRDMKRINGGPVTIDNIDEGIAAVEVHNPYQIIVECDAFPDNALPIAVGVHEKQCECVMFPDETDQKEWMLFIETKYVDSLENAQKIEYGYPQLMVTQIKKTVEYFRAKNIMSPDKRVHAIISFPTVEDGFDSWCFPVTYKDGTTETVEDILMGFNIHIRATNCARIISAKRLKLGERP